MHGVDCPAAVIRQRGSGVGMLGPSPGGRVPGNVRAGGSMRAFRAKDFLALVRAEDVRGIKGIVVQMDYIRGSVGYSSRE